MLNDDLGFIARDIFKAGIELKDRVFRVRLLFGGLQSERYAADSSTARILTLLTDIELVVSVLIDYRPTVFIGKGSVGRYFKEIIEVIIKA